MAVSKARKSLAAGVGLACLVALQPMAAFGETLTGALAKAYENNPPLNAVRAAQRALDEGIAIAKSGYRPNVNATVNYGTSSRGGASGGPTAQAEVNITQNLFNGFQTRNAVRGARAAAFSGQEQVRATEQQTLLSAVIAYTNVIRDQRIVAFQRQNISFLDEQLSAAQARFEVGEGTRTDVAQARAGRAAAVADLEAAQAQLESSIGEYIQIVGSAPDNLDRPSAPTSLLPNTLDQGVQVAMVNHPDIKAAQFDVEQNAFGVKQIEGQFLPSVDVAGSAGVVRSDVGGLPGVGGGRSTDETFSVNAQVTIPIYQQGAVSAQSRQAKEQLSQARILVDSARRDVRSDVVDAFSNYRASLAAQTATRAQIEAARLAVEGLVEERAVGQRTTLDVLLGQQNLIDAQILAAQNDATLVAASYALVAATGRLNARVLGLPVTLFDPDEHLVAVKDKWYGLRTPDQR